MKSSMLLVILVFVAFPTASDSAESGFYLGPDLVIASYDEAGFPTLNPTAVGIRGGYGFNEHFALELRAGTGVADDSVTVLGVPVSFEIDRYVGLYGRGLLPLSDRFSLYGLLGYSDGKATASGGGLTLSASDSDISFGLGADFKMTSTATLSAEWTRFLDETDYTLDGFVIGIRWRFGE